MTHTPRALSQHLSIQSVGAELLVYDELRHQAFCLNRTSAAVFSLADGTRTPGQIAEAATLELKAPVSEDLARFALSELGRDGLLELEAEPAILTAVSRRELMRKLGAGAVMMVPVVAMVMAPAAAQAYSGCFNCSAIQSQTQRQPNKRMQQLSITNPTFTNVAPGCHGGTATTATSIGTNCEIPGTSPDISIGTFGATSANPFLP